MAEIHTEFTDKLMDAVLLLKDKDEAYAFFDDLCTINELQDLGKRLEAAKMLEAGMNYQQISKKLGISTATISRVSKCLNYGTGGYKRMLRKTKG